MEKPRPLDRDTDFYSLDNLSEPISDDAAFNEIATAVMRLNVTLRKNGFEPIKSVELGSHKDGYRMRHILPRDMLMAMPAQSLRDENDTDVLFNLMGVEFRYPAGFRRERGRTKII